MSEQLAIQKWESKDLRLWSKVKRYVNGLQSTIAINAAGIPTAFVDPMKIMATGMIIDVDHFIDNPPPGCVKPVTLYEGIITFQGSPIWEIWENENAEMFELFRQYRNLTLAGAKRSVFKLSQLTGISCKVLETIRQVYQWSDRCAAYDLYLQTEREQLREIARLEIENRHASTAKTLFNLASKYLTDHEELITPKIALTMLELAVRLERAATGMSLANNSRRPGEVAVNIQNNIDSSNANAGAQIEIKGQAAPGTAGSSDEAKERLTQVLNVMSNLNLFNPEASAEVVDVEVQDE